MADENALPGERVSDAEIEGLLSPRGSARTPADPRSDPSEEEWAILDFVRSQHEHLAASLTPEQQSVNDAWLAKLRDGLVGLGFPVEDKRALHSLLLGSVLLYNSELAEFATCPACFEHAWMNHTLRVYGDFGLLMRSLLKDAGVRPPIQPGPDDRPPTSDPDQSGSTTWKDQE